MSTGCRTGASFPLNAPALKALALHSLMIIFEPPEQHLLSVIMPPTPHAPRKAREDEEKYLWSFKPKPRDKPREVCPQKLTQTVLDGHLRAVG